MQVGSQEGDTELSKNRKIKLKGGFAVLRKEGRKGCIKGDGLDSQCGPRLCEEAMPQPTNGRLEASGPQMFKKQKGPTKAQNNSPSKRVFPEPPEAIKDTQFVEESC